MDGPGGQSSPGMRHQVQDNSLRLDEVGTPAAKNVALPRKDFDLSEFDDNEDTICRCGRLVDIIPDLSRFCKLEKLILSSNLFTVVDVSTMPVTLASLNLSNNKIEEIRGLEALVNLECLDLSGNRLTKMDGVTGRVNLKSLYISKNTITSIKGIESLRNLLILDLSKNRIKKLEDLDALSRLSTLVVNDTEIESFNGIQNLAYLYRLSAERNGIASLDHLEQLRWLATLQVKNNRISSWSEVEKLAKLPYLRTVSLKGNPVETQDPANYSAAALRALPQVKSIDWIRRGQLSQSQL